MQDRSNACPGDSGGPFACNGKLTGVASFGKKGSICVGSSAPMSYVKIHPYIKWIESNTLPETSIAIQGQFPHQVSWRYIGTGTTKYHFCGGSIFNRSTIITAAHCCNKIGSPIITKQNNKIMELSDTLIVGGILTEKTELEHAIMSKVKSHVMHPDYDSLTHQNDICLLTLESPFEFNENVDRIQLDNDQPSNGDICKVSGWSDYEYKETQKDPIATVKPIDPGCSWGGNPKSDDSESERNLIYFGAEIDCYYLQWTKVQIKTADECSKAYENATFKYDSSSMICGVSILIH